MAVDNVSAPQFREQVPQPSLAGAVEYQEEPSDEDCETVGGSPVHQLSGLRPVGDGSGGPGGGSALVPASQPVGGPKKTPADIDVPLLPSTSSRGSPVHQPSGLRLVGDGSGGPGGDSALVPASQPVGGPKNTPADITVPRVPTTHVIAVEEADKEVEENDCDPFVLTEGWIETKIYQYLIHPVQPYHDSFGVVLRGLRIKKDDGSWSPFLPEQGQVVKLHDREFTLILCIQTKKAYRLWIHNGSESFVCAPKDVQSSIFLQGDVKISTLKSRIEVLV